jgi:hypothetical protein
LFFEADPHPRVSAEIARANRYNVPMSTIVLERLRDILSYDMMPKQRFAAHFFDERGHALSSYDVQEMLIRQLREENARLGSNLAKINTILAKSKAAHAAAAHAAKSPLRMH